MLLTAPRCSCGEFWGNGDWGLWI